MGEFLFKCGKFGQHGTQVLVYPVEHPGQFLIGYYRKVSHVLDVALLALLGPAEQDAAVAVSLSSPAPEIMSNPVISKTFSP